LEIIVQALLNGLMLAGIYAISSIGLSLVFGTLGIPNSAHASFIVLGSFISYFAFYLLGIDPLMSIPLCMGVLFILSIPLQKLLAIFVGAPHQMYLLATYLLGIILENLMIIMWKNEYRMIIPSYSYLSIPLNGLSLPLVRLITFVVSLGAIACLAAFLKFTFIGKAIRALAQDRDGAFLVGVDVKRLELITFGLGAGLAGCAGPLFATVFSFYPAMHNIWIGTLFIIVVVGGVGSITGTLLGSIVIGISRSLSGCFLPILAGDIITYIILLLVLLVKPSGLLGGR
jgi:branched-chain amino acid transport system permease protein